MEDDDHPESVDHEECEAAVVSQGFEVARHFSLVVLVFDERVEVAFDELLVEDDFARVQEVHLAVV